VTQTPQTLLRFFDTEEHARFFIAGKIRCGLLECYRKTEGARRDDTEGIVSFEWDFGGRASDQNIRYSGGSLNRYFIVCTADPEADWSRLIEKFGRFIVH